MFCACAFYFNMLNRLHIALYRLEYVQHHVCLFFEGFNCRYINIHVTTKLCGCSILSTSILKTIKIFPEMLLKLQFILYCVKDKKLMIHLKQTKNLIETGVCVLKSLILILRLDVQRITLPCAIIVYQCFDILICRRNSSILTYPVKSR